MSIRGSRMKNKLYCKFLAVGIILLFIGVSVSSGFALDTNQSLRINQSEECNECEKTDSGICDFLFGLWDHYFKKAGYCWEMATYFGNMERYGLFYMYIGLMYLYGQIFGVSITIMEILECENFP
jgi:hypothetical protein